jgi:hypothetical protein
MGDLVVSALKRCAYVFTIAISLAIYFSIFAEYFADRYSILFDGYFQLV